MIVANNLSGITEVYLGNEGIAQVYYGSHLVWPIEPPSIPMKLMFTTDEDEEFSFDCTHQGTILPNIYTPQPNYVLTSSEVLDLCYDNGANEKSFTSITIGDCVTEISNYAFKFNNTVGGKDFQSLRNIQHITIGNSITELGEEVFYPVSATYWLNLTGITLSNNLQTIGKNAFIGRRSVRNFTFPNSLVTIGEGAFANCVSAKFSFNSNIETIGKNAFLNCVSMQNITIPNSTTSLGESAFQGCTGATTLSIGGGIRTISANTFNGCSSLKRIDIPNNVININENAFTNCTSASALTIGSGCKTIGSSAFTLNTSLKTVTMGDKVIRLGNSAFKGCGSLESIRLSETLDTVEDNCFQNTALKEITFPDSVYELGSGLFYMNYSLKKIVIGSGVEKIGGKYGIYGCTSFTCKATTPPTLNGNLVFGEGVDYKIFVPSESVDDYKNASQWSNHADHIYPISE